MRRLVQFEAEAEITEEPSADGEWLGERPTGHVTYTVIVEDDSGLVMLVARDPEVSIVPTKGTA